MKTPDSAPPLPLSQLACDILKEWKREQGSESPFVSPSPQSPGKPTRSVKRAWRAAEKQAGVPNFPVYNLLRVFCTRLSCVAPDAVVQRAMRHSSPEMKRHYQPGMVNPVHKSIERANQRSFQGKQKLLCSCYGEAMTEKEVTQASW